MKNENAMYIYIYIYMAVGSFFMTGGVGGGGAE